jgi:hypothetical protein
MRLLSFVALLVASTALPACSLPGGAVGCDFREGSVNGPEARCQERTGAQSAGFDAMCASLGGDAVDGGCPMDGVVAGCTAAAPAGDITDWYYEPTTMEEITADCEGEGEVIEP